MGYVLIGTELSQFSGKVRACLRWKGVPFEDRLATPEVYRDIVEARIGYRVIPVLIAPDGAVLQESSAMIEHLDQAGLGEGALPSGGLQKLVSLLVELYSDEWLAIPAAHYRWSFDDAWILESIGALSASAAPAEEKRRIGDMATRQYRESLPGFGVTEGVASGIEAHFEGFLADFSDHLRTTPFVLGGRPCLADFALFGALFGPVYLDPTASVRLRRLAPIVVEWIEKMLSPEPGEQLLNDDAIPTTLYPILKRQMAEQLPSLVESMRLLGEWAAAQPFGARIPRSIGSHEFVIGGRRGGRNALSHSLWRLQRLLDHYTTLDTATRTRALDLLDKVGGSGLAALQMPRRMARRDYRLVLA